MPGRQVCRATCRQGHCLSAMQPGRDLRHMPDIPIPSDSSPLVLGGLERPIVALQAARSKVCAPPFRLHLYAQTATASGTCSFPTAWRAARSRRPSRRHPQRLASRVLHVQPAPTVRQRSTLALAERLPAVAAAVTCGRGRSRSFAARRTTSPAPLRLDVSPHTP